MTREEILGVPHRKWGQDIGEFDALVIVPLGPPMRWRLVNWIGHYLGLARLQRWGDRRWLHDSGFRFMDFVACQGEEPVFRLSGCSDVIHLDGIGGFGPRWVERYGRCPETIPPSSWNMDCLPTSGLLRLWGREKMIADDALSSFSVYINHKQEGKK
jgi:hypothetical protein